MYRNWHLFWLIWFLTSFGTFLAVEIYALCTDYKRTLSEAIWAMEKVKDGQPISHWTAGHFLFTFTLILVCVWLIGHFGWHLWH